MDGLGQVELCSERLALKIGPFGSLVWLCPAPRVLAHTRRFAPALSLATLKLRSYCLFSVRSAHCAMFTMFTYCSLNLRCAQLSLLLRLAALNCASLRSLLVAALLFATLVVTPQSLCSCCAHYRYAPVLARSYSLRSYYRYVLRCAHSSLRSSYRFALVYSLRSFVTHVSLRSTIVPYSLRCVHVISLRSLHVLVGRYRSCSY
jgi:hypothetical protein